MIKPEVHRFIEVITVPQPNLPHKVVVGGKQEEAILVMFATLSYGTYKEIKAG